MSISSNAPQSRASICRSSNPRSALVSQSSNSPKVEARETFDDLAEENVEDICPADEGGDGRYPKASTGETALMPNGTAGLNGALSMDDTMSEAQSLRRFCIQNIRSPSFTRNFGLRTFRAFWTICSTRDID